MAGSLMDALHGFCAWGLGDAPHHAGLGIAPGALKIDALVVLNVQVCLMRLFERLWRHAVHAVMDVHELGHRAPPVRFAPRAGAETA
jgi:hypothetical protein